MPNVASVTIGIVSAYAASLPVAPSVTISHNSAVVAPRPPNWTTR
jgi:hypothetical protein